MNNFTQAIICDDLGMTEYMINGQMKADYVFMKTKEKADLLECEYESSSNSIGNLW